MKEFVEKIAITIYGTDTKGEMFVEDTTTQTIAHEWIKVAIRKRVTPGSEIIVFNKSNGNQAEYLVEEQDATGLYRARLKDLGVDVWEKDFGVAAAPAEDTRPKLHLICKNCGTQESVVLTPDDHTKALSGEVLWRRCGTCVEETDWQAESWLAEQRRRDDLRRLEKRKADALAAPPLPSSEVAPPIAAAAPAPPTVPAPKPEPPPPMPPTPEPLATPEPLPTPVLPPSLVPHAAPAAATPAASPAAASPTAASPAAASPPAPINWADRRGSRRIQMKTRVRVRRPDGRQLITSPLNVSKGGIAFESAEPYVLDEKIWVAMHYREGEQPMETPGSIVRITPRESMSEFGVRFN